MFSRARFHSVRAFIILFSEEPLLIVRACTTGTLLVCLARCHKWSRELKCQLAYNLEYWPDKVCILFSHKILTNSNICCRRS